MNKTHISGHGVAGIEKSSRFFFATDRVDFWPLVAHVVAQIELQDHHRELGEVEVSRKSGGHASGETKQPLPTNISSVKVTKTFTDEIFVGKGYL